MKIQKINYIFFFLKKNFFFKNLFVNKYIFLKEFQKFLKEFPTVQKVVKIKKIFFSFKQLTKFSVVIC